METDNQERVPTHFQEDQQMSSSEYEQQQITINIQRPVVGSNAGDNIQGGSRYTVNDFDQESQAMRTEHGQTLGSKGQETSLVVEVELGTKNLPKPLLSGYFNSNLNSVGNINQVAKSLDSQHGISGLKSPSE